MKTGARPTEPHSEHRNKFWLISSYWHIVLTHLQPMKLGFMKKTSHQRIVALRARPTHMLSARTPRRGSRVVGGMDRSGDVGGAGRSGEHAITSRSGDVGGAGSSGEQGTNHQPKPTAKPTNPHIRAAHTREIQKKHHQPSEAQTS
jgi:hypothetical protein